MSRDKPTVAIPDSDDVLKHAPGSTPDLSAPAEDPQRLAQELKETRDRLLRAQAEVQNVTRRLSEESDAAIRHANASFARSLLTVWDNLERTLAHCRDHHEQDPVIQGVRLTHEIFRKMLADHGIEPIDAVGKPFDPTQHEALMREPSRDMPEGYVLREFERGFRMKDRVLRAAKVVIAAAPDSDAPAPS